MPSQKGKYTLYLVIYHDYFRLWKIAHFKANLLDISFLKTGQPRRQQKKENNDDIYHL